VGRPFLSERPLSRFGRYVVELCEAKQIKPTHLKEVFGSTKRMSYALRPYFDSRRGASLLTFEELSALAHALHADRQQTRKLILLGLLEHAPAELQAAVIRLVNDNGHLAADLGRAAPPLDYSLPMPQLDE
jgi:hypothetical protein